MNTDSRFLPSTQYMVTVSACILASAVVIGAYALTKSRNASNISVSDQTATTNDWQASLRAIQARNASTSLPAPVPSQSVQQALSETNNGNLTDSIGKNLFIELTNASTQGMSSNAQTQSQILADAAAQIQPSSITPYTLGSLSVVSNSSAAMHTYGNAVVRVLQSHPGASASRIFMAVGYATDNNDTSRLKSLPGVAKEYSGIAKQLAALPVPQGIAPIHLLVVNDYLSMAASISDMIALQTDPLKSVAALNQFDSLSTEELRLFTNIAQQLEKNAILFNKSEPGEVWSTFLVSTS